MHVARYDTTLRAGRTCRTLNPDQKNMTTMYQVRLQNKQEQKRLDTYEKTLKEQMRIFSADYCRERTFLKRELERLNFATNYHGHHTRTRKAKDAWIDNQVAFAESAALSRKRRESQRKECLGYKVETKGKRFPGDRPRTVHQSNRRKPLNSVPDKQRPHTACYNTNYNQKTNYHEIARARLRMKGFQAVQEEIPHFTTLVDSSKPQTRDKAKAKGDFPKPTTVIKVSEFVDDIKNDDVKHDNNDVMKKVMEEKKHHPVVEGDASQIFHPGRKPSRRLSLKQVEKLENLRVEKSSSGGAPKLVLNYSRQQMDLVTQKIRQSLRMHDQEIKQTAETLIKKRQAEAEARKKEEELSYDKNGRQLNKRPSKDIQKPGDPLDITDGFENLHFVDRWKKMNQMVNNFENSKGQHLQLNRGQNRNRQSLSTAQERSSLNRKLLAERHNADDYNFTAEDAFKVLNTKYLRLTKMNIDQMEKICMDEGIDVTQLHAHITDERNRNELMGSVFKTHHKKHHVDKIISNTRRISTKRRSKIQVKDSKMLENNSSKLKADKVKGSKQQFNEQKVNVTEPESANPTILLDVPS